MDEFLILQELNTPSKVFTNTTNAVFIKTISSTCFTDRTKQFFLRWQWVAQGGIGGTTNYNGRELVGIIEAWNAGDIEAAREKQNFSQDVINVIVNYRGNIVGGKRIMKLIGLDLGKNRTPFQNMTDEEELAMKKELETIGFFERCNKFWNSLFIQQKWEIQKHTAGWW